MTDFDPFADEPPRADEPMELICRPRKLIRWSIFSSVCIVAAFVALGLSLKASEAGVMFTTFDQVGIGGVGVILAVGALMWTRPRVWANSQRVRVRNVFTTKVLPWGVVRQISVSSGATWGVLDLHDDDRLSMLGIQIADGQPAIDALRRLRELHEASTHRAGPAS